MIVTVASVGLLTTTLLTVMPSPNVKTVAGLQCVFWPWTSTVIVVPCGVVFGLTAEISARLGVTVKPAPPTVWPPVVAVTLRPPS